MSDAKNMETEVIILEIDGTPLPCKKSDLVENSDYFRAMLQGSFREKDQSRITIEGVDLKAMNIILILLWDTSCIIDDEDILMVLQGACMLQFEKVKCLCLDKVIERLAVKNSLKIWLMAWHLSLKPLYLKAKLLALEEFLEIKDSEAVLELTLEELSEYLGNVYLKTDNELSVFQTAMKWWYENSQEFSDNSTNVILRLLSCVDFKNFSDTFFDEIVTYPDISKNSEILEILTCLRYIKEKKITDSFSKDVKDKAELLYMTKSRMSAEHFGLLVNSIYKSKSQERDQNSLVIRRDKYMRKHVSKCINADAATEFVALYYAKCSNELSTLFEIDRNKWGKLEGFAMLRYKELVLMFGGQYTIGRGGWNYGLWAYDFLRERWERKSTLPYPRRHFETCVVDTKIFITGGTGLFRIAKENMFWYDYKRDTWSKEIVLPVFDRDLKNCCFHGKYFLLSVSNKCGYFYSSASGNNMEWKKVEIIGDKQAFRNLGQFGVFSYKNKLYVKGKKLIELELVDNKMLIVSIKAMTTTYFNNIGVALCNNLVYTYYKRSPMLEAYGMEVDDMEMCNTWVHDSLEVYDMETGEINFIFRDRSNNVIGSALKIFTFSHYSLVEENKLVNVSFK